MNPENPGPKSESALNPDERLQSAIARSWQFINRSRMVAGSPRQIMDAGFLSVCLLFLVAMVGLQRFDLPLTIALIAFWVALPCLGYALVVLLFQFAPTPAVRPGNHPVRDVADGEVVDALTHETGIIEGIGQVAVLVGILALAFHFGITALLGCAAGIIVILLITLRGSFALRTRSARARRIGM